MRCLAAGAPLSYAQAVSRPESPTHPTQPLVDRLTERELEILRLIAEGENNADIAQTLSITERTVKGHVSNILSKLHLRDRTQAAVLAWREGMMQ